MRHAGEVGEHGRAADVLAEREAQLGLALLEFVRGQHLAQVNRFAMDVGQLDADHRAPRHDRDTHRHRAHGAGDIVGQRHDAAGFGAGRGLKLIKRDNGARAHFDDLAFDAEILQHRFQHARVAFQGFARNVFAGALHQRRGGQDVQGRQVEVLLGVGQKAALARFHVALGRFRRLARRDHGLLGPLVLNGRWRALHVRAAVFFDLGFDLGRGRDLLDLDRVVIGVFDLGFALGERRLGCLARRPRFLEALRRHLERAEERAKSRQYTASRHHAGAARGFGAHGDAPQSQERAADPGGDSEQDAQGEQRLGRNGAEARDDVMIDGDGLHQHAPGRTADAGAHRPEVGRGDQREADGQEQHAGERADRAQPQPGHRLAAHQAYAPGQDREAGDARGQARGLQQYVGHHRARIPQGVLRAGRGGGVERGIVGRVGQQRQQDRGPACGHQASGHEQRGALQHGGPGGRQERNVVGADGGIHASPQKRSNVHSDPSRSFMRARAPAAVLRSCTKATRI